MSTATNGNAPTLTTDHIETGLRGLGLESSGNSNLLHRNAACPACGTDKALTYGGEPGAVRLECAQDCARAEIAGALAAGARLLGFATSHPLQYVRNTLAEQALKRIAKHGRDGSRYVLHYADDSTVDLGDAAALLNQTRTRATYLGQRGRLPTAAKLTSTAWDRLAESIDRAAEHDDNVTTSGEETRSYLAGIVAQGVTVDTDDADALYQALDTKALPGVIVAKGDGRVHVRLPALLYHVNHDLECRTTMRELSVGLAAVGFQKAQLAARRGKDVRKARYWAAPDGFEVDA